MGPILVIDDDRQVRRAIRQVLERRGFQVEEARDGQEGVERFVKRRHELVITDVVMPRREGLETLRQILRLEPEARVIVTSGVTKRSDYLHYASHMGALAVLKKPFGSRELMKAVEQALPVPA